MRLKWGLLTVAGAMLALPCAVHAQRAAENAVNASDDAFGTNVGNESTGIYTENDTRGFSPLKAGNYRLDGVYFDPVATVSGRLRAGSAIRVGFAAHDYPFPAPTGIVDVRLRSPGEEALLSTGLSSSPFGGWIVELDGQLPLVKDRLGTVLGFGASSSEFSDGSSTGGWGFTVKPLWRSGGVELSPFITYGQQTGVEPRTVVVVNGADLPALPKHAHHYLGQDWAKGLVTNITAGTTARAALADGLSFRGGLFYSGSERQRNYSEIFVVTGPGGAARHLFISDPRQNLYSWSGEGQLAWRFAAGGLNHRLIAGYRMRDRHTDSGGSDLRNFGTVTFGEEDDEPRPQFHYTPVSVGTVRQGSLMLGYSAKLDGVGQVNLGVQKARYRASFRDAATGRTSQSSDDPWLYDASVLLPVTARVSAFFGTERGLEDSGAAPESAANRNEQLPATRSKQVEAGLRWKAGRNSVAVSLFEITKPYFAFDAGNAYADLGTVSHRGLEASFSGHSGKRFNLLAGAVLMRPRVTGAARDAGLVGKRPAGTPSLFARIDANYRTDIWGGLTPTMALTYTGRRAAGSRPQAALGGGQLMLPAHVSLDLGLREQFMLGKLPASLRATISNVLDDRAWKVVAANTLYIDERRRGMFVLAVDL